MERIKGRPWVGKDINPILLAWKATYGVPMGRGLTAAVRFAATHRDFKLPLTGRKMNLPPDVNL